MDEDYTASMPSHQERPFHNLDIHNEMMKWYDYWLKGIDTGIMEEPPMRYWVTGENKWRYASNWPAPETRWTPLYFDCWERLRPTPVDADAFPISYLQKCNSAPQNLFIHFIR